MTRIIQNLNSILGLLKKRVVEELSPNNIIGYCYSVGYNTEDWDLPI